MLIKNKSSLIYGIVFLIIGSFLLTKSNTNISTVLCGLLLVIAVFFIGDAFHKSYYTEEEAKEILFPTEINNPNQRNIEKLNTQIS